MTFNLLAGPTGPSGPQGSNGMVKLTSATITTPVAYFDLALPAGYISFLIEINGISFSATETLLMFVSANGGVSFVADNTNYDSYAMTGAEIFLNTSTPIRVATTDTGVDLIGITSGTGTQTPNFGVSVVVDLFPGDATHLPCGTYRSVWEDAVPELVSTNAVFSLWPEATVPPVKARATTLRFAPYGNGDANPPTSGQTITAGSYVLWGISS